MKYTFKIVPTNYIVWQTGLIPNFGRKTQANRSFFSLDLIFLHLFRWSPNRTLEAKVDPFRLCRSDPLVLLCRCSLFLHISFFFSALCCSFFFLLFLCWVCCVVVYIELKPSRLEFPHSNRLLYTQDLFIKYVLLSCQLTILLVKSG